VAAACPQAIIGRMAQLTLLLVLLTLALAGCGPAPPAVVGGDTMGTTWSARLAALPENLDAEQVRQRLARRLTTINATMSNYDSTAELARLNAARSTDWLPVSAELLEVLAAAQDLSRETDGAFDVTIGSLINAWGFGPRGPRPTLPDAAEITAALASGGWRKLELRANPPALRKADPGLEIDLSAIVPGYAADRLAQALDELGVPAYLVDVGGEIRARGRRPDGAPWRVAVEQPSIDRSGLQWIVDLDGQAIATSGDYRNFIEQGGQRYPHIIDPRTGRPVQHGLASVTVIADSAMTADALATTLLVLGPEAGAAFAEARALPAAFISRTPDGFSASANARFSARLHE